MNAPALVVAIPLFLGVLLGAALRVPTAVVIGATAVACVSSAIALWRGSRIVVIALCAGFFAAGIAIGDREQRAATGNSLLHWYQRTNADRPVTLSGVLRADAAPGAAGTALVLDVRTADGEAVDGGVRLSVAGALASAAARQWRGGRSVALSASLHVPVDYRDPGVPSDRERQARQGIALLGAVKSAALVTVTSRGTWISEAAAALRARVRSATSQSVGRWSPASAAVVTAILIGDRSALDAEDERRLQEAGTYHVIAISGGNIALLTALLLLCGRLARFPSRATAAAAIAILAFYGYAAGLAPSVLRATVAGMVYLAARAADHRGAALNAVAVAAAYAAVSAPLTLLDPGFVLSFGATFAIIVAAQRVRIGPQPDRAARVHSRLRRALAATVRAAAALGIATLCAEIALAPVGARLFGRVSFAGLVLNFIAIPLMSIIQIAGLLAVAINPLSITLASAPGWIAHVATVGVLRSATLVDAAPWLVLDVPPPGWAVVAAWYAGWSVLLFARSRMYRAPGAAIVLIAAATMIVAPPATRATRVASAPSGWLRIVFLDVGQGDATLVLPPGAEPILVDAGGVPGKTFDVGRRVTLPAAWAFGVSRLGALVLTHGDPDHIGGAPAILRALAPREIWEGIPVDAHQPLQRLHELAARDRIPWKARRAGETLSPGVSIRVLNPAAPTWERIRVRNDDSIVLELRIGAVAIVLPGDVTSAVEAEVAAAFEPAPTVIVKAPHHGSAGSSSPAFISAMHPAAVVFSAGARNPFGHPAPAVVERYRAAGAQLFSTAEDGAVIADTNGHLVRICGWASGRCGTFLPEAAR